MVAFIVEEATNKKGISGIGWDKYVRIVLYIISLLGVIIHNEIVVVNICGLGSDTKYFLDIEVKYEEMFTITDNPEELKRYETLDEQNNDNSFNERENIIKN